MFITSQDGMNLVHFKGNCLFIEPICNDYKISIGNSDSKGGESVRLGRYKDIKRCMEILNEIKLNIANNRKFYDMPEN